MSLVSAETVVTNVELNTWLWTNRGIGNWLRVIIDQVEATVLLFHLRIVYLVT